MHLTSYFYSPLVFLMAVSLLNPPLFILIRLLLTVPGCLSSSKGIRGKGFLLSPLRLRIRGGTMEEKLLCRCFLHMVPGLYWAFVLIALELQQPSLPYSTDEVVEGQSHKRIAQGHTA